MLWYQTPFLNIIFITKEETMISVNYDIVF